MRYSYGHDFLLNRVKGKKKQERKEIFEEKA
jgi:hypothetical protein